MKYCEKLNELGKAPKGWKFVLPTETQWEYAARGGSRTKGYKYSGSSNIDDVAWYKLDKTHPVAQKHPNELGLYDMSGNVWEWCLDDWKEDSRQSIPEFSRENTYDGKGRVYRGGYWGAKTQQCRSSFRQGCVSDYSDNDIGFRLALVPLK